MKGRYRVPIYPIPSRYSFLCQRLSRERCTCYNWWTYIITQDHGLFGVHSWCCIFYGFKQMYKNSLSLQCHKSTLTTLEILCALPLHSFPLSNPWQPQILFFTLCMVFVFSRMLYNWNRTSLITFKNRAQIAGVRIEVVNCELHCRVKPLSLGNSRSFLLSQLRVPRENSPIFCAWKKKVWLPVF